MVMTSGISIRQLPSSELARLAEIDRSEIVTLGYRVKDGKLQAEKVNWQVARWSIGGGPHSVEENINAWQPIVQNGGVLLGAFDGDRLVGVAILRYRLTDTMAQLAVLHVSKDYRRQGIGQRLTQEVIRLAQADGAKELYVSGTPSESAVGFYQAQGFELTSQPHAELYKLEPEDIHMILRL